MQVTYLFLYVGQRMLIVALATISRETGRDAMAFNLMKEGRGRDEKTVCEFA
tara:strand:- start:212 stop:367 length:156 start_codon:yes stop_codon:yes gene_type:complete